MRAVFLCPTLAVGGAERLLSTLVLALVERGVDAKVISINHAGRFFEEVRAAGVEVDFVDARSRYDISALRRAVASVRVGRPDVVVTQSVNAHVLGHIAARQLSAPHVAIEHRQPELRTTVHRRLLLRLAAPHVDAVVAVTAAQERTLVSLGYRLEAIRVIPNGVPRPQVERPREAVRAALGVGDDELLALLVATLRPEKDAVSFVEAVAAARRNGSAIKGLIAGSGPELALVQRRALAVEGVTVLGERSDVPDLMAASDVVCLSSRAEALPMVLLEAMALGRPVLATTVGGVPEVVTPDVGVLVPPRSPAALAEALRALAQDRERREQLGSAARDRYESLFTLDRIAEAYLRLLTDVVEARSPGRGRPVQPTAAG